MDSRLWKILAAAVGITILVSALRHEQMPSSVFAEQHHQAGLELAGTSATTAKPREAPQLDAPGFALPTPAMASTTAKPTELPQLAAPGSDWLTPAMAPITVKPWEPPQLDAEGIAQVERGILGSVLCNQSCEMQRHSCRRHGLIPQCYNTTCICRNNVQLPSEILNITNTSMRRFALIMAGQTRSLNTNVMRNYWRRILSDFNDDLVLLAAISTSSQQKVKKTSFNKTVTKFKPAKLYRLLQSLNVSHIKAVFLDSFSAEAAAAHVRDPALRQMLEHSAKSETKLGGFWNGYRSRVVAFDLMLQVEEEFGGNFQHILVLRPDVVVDFGWRPTVFAALFDDAVYSNDDLITIIPRHLAVWFFTFISTGRSIGRLEGDAKNSWSALHGRLWARFSKSQSPLPNQIHLAFHGVPFCGIILRALPNIQYKNAPHTSWWIIRDYVSNGSKILCADIRDEVYPNLTSLNTYLSKWQVTMEQCRLG